MTGTRRRGPCPLLLAAALLPLAGGCGDSPSEPNHLLRAEIAAITIEPAAGAGLSTSGIVLAAGASVRLLAVDAAGRPLAAAWASSAPGVVGVAEDGMAAGVAAGSGVVTAATGAGAVSVAVRVAPADEPAACEGMPHLRLVQVSTSEALSAALAAAQPGDQIRLADGVYTGSFRATARGTADRPITLCGRRGAVLTTGALDRGHGLWLEGASHWIVHGMTVARSLGGITVTAGSRNVIEEVEVREVGQHGIHVSALSSQNVVRRNVVHRTGRRMPQYGEGIYVGTHSDRWCTLFSCRPDRSDGNQVVENLIGPYVTAEHVQVMEGTTGGVIRGNRFEGAGMGAPADTLVDSWVAVMGSGWTVEDNVGIGSPRNGFEVWVALDGWGTDNVFRRNDADVRAGGYGFHASPRAVRTVIGCDNAVRNAGSGFANVGCR